MSDKQLAANRANAQNSTGPRTPLGKARSSRNARKHTFAGTDFAIIKIEELESVNHLRADLIAVYRPVNSQELFAVERIALAQHHLLRMARFEAGLFTSALNEALLIPSDETPYVPLHQSLEVDAQDVKVQNRYYCLAYGFHYMNKQNSSTWALFLRYQTQAERQYRRAVEEFERLKALRSELPNEPIFEPEPEENTTASASQNEPISDPESKCDTVTLQEATDEAH
jgi:hypothetical protein